MPKPDRTRAGGNGGRLPEADQEAFYRISLQGRLGPEWADWFDGLSISADEGTMTVLSGRVEDQAALYGHLKRARDAGLTLLSVTRIDPKRDREEI